MVGGAFRKLQRRPDLTRWKAIWMESIQQALYEAESFLPSHLSNEGRAIGKAKYLKL